MFNTQWLIYPRNIVVFLENYSRLLENMQLIADPLRNYKHHLN